jgi:hypothetical protein
MCRLSWNLGASTSHYEPVQVCNGIDIPLYIISMFYIKKRENYRLSFRWHVFHICSPKLWEYTQIDDYKLSRTIRIAEILFAILSQKVMIFYDQNQASSKNTDSVTLSVHVLHNYVRNICNAQDSVFVDKNDTWKSPYITIFCPLGGNTSEEATSINKIKYRDFFEDGCQSVRNWKQGKDETRNFVIENSILLAWTSPSASYQKFSVTNLQTILIVL